MKRVIVVLAFAALAVGCKRQKPPVAKRIWLGAHGGCMATTDHPVTGTFACWGKLPEEPVAEPVATRRFDAGEKAPLEIGFAERVTCRLWEGNRLVCSDGERKGQSSFEDTITGTGLTLASGFPGVCVGSTEGVHCRGVGDVIAKDWPRSKVRAVAVGRSHVCAAYDGGRGVICRGYAEAPPATLGDAAVLAGLDATRIAAGDAHTCAILADHTVKCWGRNEAGQLGDHTTRDSKAPVQVLGLGHVARIAAGRAHTCALIGNGTVHCWGNNEHHQLANGGTANDPRAQMVLGILGVSEISAAADATCALLSKDGEVRCWGHNDGQLGDPTLQEHTVPAPVRFH